MSTIAKAKPDKSRPTDYDPYYYGFRDEIERRPDGTFQTKRVALTLEDHLHPHEGDKFVEGISHLLAREYLFDVFGSRLEHDPSALVLADVGIYWDIPRLGHHAPDIAVIFGVRRLQDLRQSFDVAAEGVRPRIIVEIVSPRYRDNDVDKKLEQYHDAHVPIYIVFDREKEESPFVIRAFQRRPQRYIPLPLDDDGRLWIEDLNLWVGVEGQRIHCFDGETNQEIGDYAALTNRLNEVEAQRTEFKNRAETAEARNRDLEAEIARLKSQTGAS